MMCVVFDFELEEPVAEIVPQRRKRSGVRYMKQVVHRLNQTPRNIYIVPIFGKIWTHLVIRRT